jgi:hypothetical protein
LLRDVDFDHRTGKLATSDYEIAHAEAEARALAAIQALDTFSEGATSESLEGEIAKIRSRMVRKARGV